jgi:hypothetical protein
MPPPEPGAASTASGDLGRTASCERRTARRRSSNRSGESRCGPTPVRARRAWPPPKRAARRSVEHRHGLAHDVAAAARPRPDELAPLTRVRRRTGTPGGTRASPRRSHSPAPPADPRPPAPTVATSPLFRPPPTAYVAPSGLPTSRAMSYPQKITGGVHSHFVASVYDRRVSEPDPAPASRPPGRPRKWTSEAERKRAYRARRAADLAEPERLRVELRRARQQIAKLEREATGLRRTAMRAATTAEASAKARADLEATIERLHLQVAFWRNRATETTLRQSGAGIGGSSSRARAAP